MASRHVSCFVRLHILKHVILRGVFENEKYYYISIITLLGIVTHFAGQNGEFWRAIICY